MAFMVSDLNRLKYPGFVAVPLWSSVVGVQARFFFP
uniref:Uncharacterized protein n=1 Tax=Anguilla anguilla TaxID=7936 RepID=A0A0E9VYJ9_ANGAN